MGSEFLLYGYGAVCISMLVFNIVYNVMLRGKDHRFEKKVSRFTSVIEGQIGQLSETGEVDPRHLRFLKRKLRKVSNLVAFEQVMENYLEKEDQKEALAYYDQLQLLVLSLAVFYEKKNNVKAAYFAYFISRYSLAVKNMMNALQQILVSYMKKDSLYCRVNALQALYNFGAEEQIVEAIVLLDHQRGFVHEKILTDGLLSFTGDHHHLIHLLWKRFPDFSNKTRLSLMNYIRFKTGDYKEDMLKIMKDQEIDKELRLAAIRYFERYPYEAAREYLKQFASDRDLSNWEYAAISVTALARYKGEDVVEVLLDCLHSSNWYIRSNAASSLEAHDLEYSDLIDIVGGNDRFAREMMMYRLETRMMEEKAEKQKREKRK